MFLHLHPFTYPQLTNHDMCRWLYTLCISLDGNFRLKLKNRRLDDISLQRDMAYFVNQQLYEKYVVEHKGEEYVCASHILMRFKLTTETVELL